MGYSEPDVYHYKHPVSPEEIQFVWAVGPGRRLCLFWCVSDTLTIEGSILRKTKYLPLVTFIFRFLLLYSDQVDLLVGVIY